MMMKLILIAVDGSEANKAAIDRGIELARAVGASAKFVGVHITLPIVADSYYAREVVTEREKFRHVLDRAARRARRRGVPAQYELLTGVPAEKIVEAARMHHADVVVVGSRGHGAVKRALLGSVSRAVIAHADVPVLVVRGDRTDAAARAA
jgi:nucleotide-binding universal stress UspA family protein